MAFDAASLMRMLGINPDEMLGKVAELQEIAKHFEERLGAIEEKADRILALLEYIVDEQATANAENGLVKLVASQSAPLLLEHHNGAKPNGAA